MRLLSSVIVELWTLFSQPIFATVAGGVSFGAGWALGGLCPGPGIVTVGMGSTSAAVWLLSMVGGRMVGSQLERFDPTKKKALTKGH